MHLHFPISLQKRDFPFDIEQLLIRKQVGKKISAYYSPDQTMTQGEEFLKNSKLIRLQITDSQRTPT